jgi:hypothetical protein
MAQKHEKYRGKKTKDGKVPRVGMKLWTADGLHVEVVGKVYPSGRVQSGARASRWPWGMPVAELYSTKPGIAIASQRFGDLPSRLAMLHEEAHRVGLHRTAQLLHQAVQAIGWEIAGSISLPPPPSTPAPANVKARRGCL